jgi:ADP-ribosylglycohydrolase
MISLITKKYIGTLLGGCCGDVLGSQTEGMTRSQIKERFGDMVTSMPGGKFYTDDTEMTLVLARHLVKNKRVISGPLHCEYGREITNKGYSKQTRNILNMFKNREILFLPAGTSSCDGAVMRIAPLGLLNLTSNEVLLQVKSAIFYTHGASEDAVSSAFIHCRLIRALVTSRFKTWQEYFTYVMGHCRRHLPLWVKMNLVKHCLYASTPVPSITEELLGDKNAFQIQAIDALCCAMYTFFRFYNEPMKAVCFAASMGGDTDTIAKITGDLCGALHGIDWIPHEWKGVEKEAELIKLGCELLGVK